MQLRLTHRSGETSQPTIFFYVPHKPTKPSENPLLKKSYFYVVIKNVAPNHSNTPLFSFPRACQHQIAPPPDVRNGSNFSKGSNFEIIKCEVSGQCMFVCIQSFEGADCGKAPKGISYSSPNPRSRGASGEIMAVNKTLGIIYHLLAEKCRKGKNYLHYYKINIGIKLCNNNIKYQIIHIQLILTFHFS